jgi:hypothetical protein
MKKTLLMIVTLSALAPASALADPLSQMQADASAITRMASTWVQLESTSRNYAALAPYAAQAWAGQGPVVHTLFGGEEQCHNTRYDTVTSGLITGGLNIFGDAEAEAYAIQTVTVDFQQELADYEVQQEQAGNTATVNTLTGVNGPLSTSLNTLMALLNTTGNQVAAALSPGTALQPLPISHWQAGIGDVPNLAAVQYTPGPNDGAPVGWSLMPTMGMATLVDKCPTGTGSVPMLPLDAPVMADVDQMLSDAPSMSVAVQPVEGGSSFTLPSGGLPIGGVNPEYALRMRLVSALAADMGPLSGYMAPISSPLALYQQQVQQIMSEVHSNAQ